MCMSLPSLVDSLRHIIYVHLALGLFLLFVISIAAPFVHKIFVHRTFIDANSYCTIQMLNLLQNKILCNNYLIKKMCWFAPAYPVPSLRFVFGCIQPRLAKLAS